MIYQRSNFDFAKVLTTVYLTDLFVDKFFQACKKLSVEPNFCTIKQ